MEKTKLAEIFLEKYKIHGKTKNFRKNTSVYNDVSILKSKTTFKIIKRWEMLRNYETEFLKQITFKCLP